MWLLGHLRRAALSVGGAGLREARIQLYLNTRQRRAVSGADQRGAVSSRTASCTPLSQGRGTTPNACSNALVPNTELAGRFAGVGYSCVAIGVTRGLLPVTSACSST